MPVNAFPSHLAGQPGERLQYLKAKIVLEVKDEKLVEQIKPNMPRITDLFQTYLRELRSGDLNGSIGMFRMTDEKGGDDKVLCVPAGDVRKEHLRDIHHISEYDRLEIQHFFEVYKDLEPGKSVEGASWVGRADAEKEVRAAYERYDLNRSKH